MSPNMCYLCLRSIQDTDGDGTPDPQGPDDDGDGIFTVVECPGGWSTADPCLNTDGDLLADYLDANDDNDAADTRMECPAGRVALSDPQCPASARADLEDYLNGDFARFGGGIFAPIIFVNE